MLDMKTLKNIHDSINDNDNDYVEYLREEAFKALTKLKKVDSAKGLNALERKEVAVNIEIITRAEAKLHGRDQ
jgi:hypothetical protein